MFFWNSYKEGTWNSYKEGTWDNDLPCVEHDFMECTDCMKVYGFYGKGVKLIDACDDHERTPYQYETDLMNCQKCNIIARR